MIPKEDASLENNSDGMSAENLDASESKFRCSIAFRRTIRRCVFLLRVEHLKRSDIRSPTDLTISSVEHPEWQHSRTRPLDPVAMDNEGVWSSCAGQRAVHPLAVCCTPSKKPSNSSIGNQGDRFRASSQASSIEGRGRGLDRFDLLDLVMKILSI